MNKRHQRLWQVNADLAQDRPAIREAYRYAMACERDFFAAPLRMPESD